MFFSVFGVGGLGLVVLGGEHPPKDDAADESCCCNE